MKQPSQTNGPSKTPIKSHRSHKSHRSLTFCESLLLFSLVVIIFFRSDGFYGFYGFFQGFFITQGYGVGLA
jgi:uncharacterized membrane protein